MDKTSVELQSFLVFDCVNWHHRQKYHQGTLDSTVQRMTNPTVAAPSHNTTICWRSGSCYCCCYYCCCCCRRRRCCRWDAAATAAATDAAFVAAGATVCCWSLVTSCWLRQGAAHVGGSLLVLAHAIGTNNAAISEGRIPGTIDRSKKPFAKRTRARRNYGTVS